MIDEYIENTWVGVEAKAPDHKQDNGYNPESAMFVIVAI